MNDGVNWTDPKLVSRLCKSIMKAVVTNNDDLAVPLGWEGGDAVAIVQALSAHLAACKRERDEAWTMNGGDILADMAAELEAARAENAMLRQAVSPCGCAGKCEQAPQAELLFYGRICARVAGRPLPPPPTEPTK